MQFRSHALPNPKYVSGKKRYGLLEWVWSGFGDGGISGGRGSDGLGWVRECGFWRVWSCGLGRDAARE